MYTRVTAIDIARITGYSQPTVSRALNGVKGIAPKTRKVIMQVAEELGYQPNHIARGLITGKSGMIGLVTSDIRNPFYPEVIELFAASLSKRGYHVMFVNSTSDDIKLDDVLPFIYYKVEGVIVTSAKLSSSVIKHLTGTGIPVVLFNRYTRISGCSSVSCDNVGGGQLVANALLETGHTRFAFVSGPTDTSTSIDRQKGFNSVLHEKAGCEPVVVQGGYSYQGGFDAGLKLLAMDNPPNAIFCANDIMALGVLDSARRLGIRVPDEVSVIGFDDIELAHWDAYSLTTVRQPVEEMVRHSVDLLLSETSGSSLKSTMTFIQGDLVMRNTLKNRTERV